ncbi:MAG: rhomboid family intramembrane serine protease [Bacteroidota bacterium]
MLAELVQTPVSLFFLTLNVLIGAYTLFVNPELVGRWAFRPYVVRQRREMERWLTAGFVHVGLAHLAFNVITLYFFGPLIEGVLGGWRFALIYLGSDLAANALTYWRHKDNPTYSAVGASGAISGVLFSFVLFAPFEMLYIFFAIPMPAIVFAVLYVVLSIYSAKQGGGRIAHEAHLGGALGGLALTIAVYPPVVLIFLQQFGLG